jgi:hypothetical protein
MIFKNEIPTSKKTQRVSITEIRSFMVFKEIVAAYSQNRKKLTNTIKAQCKNIYVAGTYSYHCALKQRFLIFWLLRTPTESLLEAVDP